MFKPTFNKVLVEINDEEAKWGSGNDDNMLGASYREGKAISRGELIPTADYPSVLSDKGFDATAAAVDRIIGKTIMWHEGTEAGTAFDDGGKKYGLIYWFDIIGVKSSDE